MIKDFIKKIVYREKASSETYINYLRNKGICIGEDCTIYAPCKTFIDIQYPWMISIGSHVRITEGVKILTHDYSWSVLKGLNTDEEILPGSILGASGKVTIKDNVFIGMNSIITRNVTIGNNVIIGAGSVVTRDCADNGLYAGNPAKRIMEVHDYYIKRKESQLKEAVELAIQYYERYGRKPDKSIFHEYFMLFADKSAVMEDAVFSGKMKLCGNETQSYNYLENSMSTFNDFDEFMRYCFNEK